MPTTPPKPAAGAPLREVRYSLKRLLAEIAVDRESGAFGHEKLGQADIRRAFKAKSRARRAH